jgi:hypothetical protein
VKIGKCGNWEMWKLGNVEIGKCGNLKIWKLGNVEIGGFVGSFSWMFFLA